MRSLNRAELHQLVDDRDASNGRCVSIYVPFGLPQRGHRRALCLSERTSALIERHFPETDRSSLEALAALTGLGAARAAGGSAPARGVALFKSAKISGYYLLGEPPTELAVVGDSFHLRPLLPHLQAQQNVLLLVLESSGVEVLECGPRSLVEIADFTSPCAFDVREPAATLEFFRSVDRSLEAIMRRMNPPLALSGSPELQSLFLQANGARSPFLGGVSFRDDVPPERAELHARAWALARAAIRQRVSQSLEAYQRAAPRGLGTDCLTKIATAATVGRVQTLLIERDVHLWGRLCRASGALQLAVEQDGNVATDDVLDDLAEMTVAGGGEVHLLEAHDMPTSAPICAILRPRS